MEVHPTPSTPMLTWKVNCQIQDANGNFHTTHSFIVQATTSADAKQSAWRLLEQKLPRDYSGWQVNITTEIVIDTGE
jgi:hypothetical protein